MNFNILEKEYADFSVRLEDFPNSFQIKDHEILQPSSITKLKNGLESALRVGYDTPLETARARNLLAFALFRQGEPAQALAELEQALQADAKSRNIVSMANKAAILCMTGKHYAANVQVSLLEALKEEDEDFEHLVTKAKAELAFSYTRLSHTYFSIAETLFEEVIPKAREPEKWLWTFGLALTLRRHSHLHLAPMAGASASSTDRSLRILRLLQDVINNSQSLEAKAYAEMGILLNNNRDNSPVLAAAGMDAVGACRKALMLDNKHNSVLCKCAKIFRYFRVDLARSRKLLETAISYRPTSTAYHHLGLTLKAMATVLKYQSQGATNPKRTYSGRGSRSGKRGGHSRGKPMRWRDYSSKEDELPIQNGIERQEEECQSYRGQYQSETVRGHPQRGKGQHYRGNRESERRTFTSEREIWQPERENISHEKRENYLTVDNVRRGGLQRGRGGQHLNYHGLVKHGRTLLIGDETCGLKGTGSDRQHPISDADLRADARGRGHHYQTHAGSYSQLLHNTQSGRTKVQSPTTESPHDSHEKDLSSPDRMGELGHHAFPHDTTQSPRLESEPPNSSTVHRSLEFSQADGKFRPLHTSDVTGMLDNYRMHTSHLQEATSTKQIVNNLRKTVKSPRKQTEFNSQSLEAKAYAEMGILLCNNKYSSPVLAAAGMDAVGACRKALMLDNKHNSVLCKCAKIFRYFRIDLQQSRKLLETAISYRPTSTAYHHLGLTLKVMATALKYQSQGATYCNRNYSSRESRSGNRGGHSRGKPIRWRESASRKEELPIQNSIERQDEECQSYRGQYQSETVRGHPQRRKGQHDRGKRQSEKGNLMSERGQWHPEIGRIILEKSKSYLTVDKERQGDLQRHRGGQHHYHGFLRHGLTSTTRDEIHGLKEPGSDWQNPIEDLTSEVDLRAEARGKRNHCQRQANLRAATRDGGNHRQMHANLRAATRDGGNHRQRRANLRAEVRSRGHHYQTHTGSYTQLLHNTQSGRIIVQSPAPASSHDSHDKELSPPNTTSEFGHHAFLYDSPQSPRLESELPNSSTVHRTLEFSQADGKFRPLHTSDVTGMLDNYRLHTSHSQEITSTKQIVNNLRKTVKSPRKQTEFTRADGYVPEIIECFQNAITLSKGENTRAMYDLALFYKSLGELDMALELFEELRNEGRLPVERINAFEQSGLIYLDKFKHETSSKEKMLLQKEGDSMLNFALSLASRHFSSIPQFQDHIEEIRQAFSTLDKGLDRCDLTEEFLLMEKARLLPVIKKPQEPIEFLQTLENISSTAVQNPEYIRMRLECHNAQNDFERAVTFISLQSEQIKKEVKKLFKDDQYMLKMYYEASRQVLLQNPEKVSLAQGYFRFAFEETFQNSLVPVCSSEDTDDMDSISHGDFEMNHVMFIHDYKTKIAITNAQKLGYLVRHVCGLRTSWSSESCIGLDTDAPKQIKKSRLVVVLAGYNKLSLEFRSCITSAVQSRPTVTLLVDGNHVPQALRGRPVMHCPQVILDMDLDDYGMQPVDRVDAICSVFKFLVGIKTDVTGITLQTDDPGMLR